MPPEHFDRESLPRRTQWPLVFVCLFFVVCCVVAGWLSWPSLTTRRSPPVIAIDGRGYFVAVDPQTGERWGFRTGRIALTANGQLAVPHQGRLLLIQPVMTVPADYTDIKIEADGAAMVKSAGQTYYSQFGCLLIHCQLGLDDPVLRPDITFPLRLSDEDGVIESMAGQMGAGEIVSSWAGWPIMRY